MDLEREKLYAYDDGKEAGLKEGREAGSKEKAIEDARNLLKMNLGTPEQIATAINLSLDEVLQIKNKLN